MEKKPFLTLQQAQEISKTYPTPFHIYDEKAIRENARKVKAAFAWNPGYKEYFAVKATPNPRLVQHPARGGLRLRLLELYRASCSAAPAASTGHDIMFSSNVTPDEDFKLAKRPGRDRELRRHHPPRLPTTTVRRVEGDHVLPLQSGRRLRSRKRDHGHAAAKPSTA